MFRSKKVTHKPSRVCAQQFTEVSSQSDEWYRSAYGTNIHTNIHFYIYRLIVDMFRPHMAIFRCYSILSRRWPCEAETCRRLMENKKWMCYIDGQKSKYSVSTYFWTPLYYVRDHSVLSERVITDYSLQSQGKERECFRHCLYIIYIYIYITNATHSCCIVSNVKRFWRHVLP
jgi:hypothetical protein